MRADGQSIRVAFFPPLCCSVNSEWIKREFNAKAAVCNDLKSEYLRWAVVCWGFARCSARMDVRSVIKSTSVREKLLLAQVPKCFFFCHYSLQLFHSVDFEIDSSIDLQLNINLSKYAAISKHFAM